MPDTYCRRCNIRVLFLLTFCNPRSYNCLVEFEIYIFLTRALTCLIKLNRNFSNLTVSTYNFMLFFLVTFEIASSRLIESKCSKIDWTFKPRAYELRSFPKFLCFSERCHTNLIILFACKRLVYCWQQLCFNGRKSYKKF